MSQVGPGALASTARDTASLTGSDGEGDDGEVTPTGSIGRFVVLGALGRGGMGVVLSAYDPLLDRRVALKLVRPGVWSSTHEAEGRTRLQREAQAMARLQHPNVVAVYDVGTVGDQLFVAMELVDGQTVRAWLDGGRRHWRDVARVFTAAGRGLGAAHAAGLVHRDFKPENVLIGGDGRARVGDFGLVSAPAHLASDGDGNGDVQGDGGGDDGGGAVGSAVATRAGVILGTPGYMSPEQMRGQPVDAQSDQFSFCVAFYEALHGQRPGPGRRPRRRVPRALTRVLLRGLDARREARWPSMDALLDGLGRATAPRLGRGARLVAAALAGLGLVAGVALARAPRAAVCSGAGRRLAGVWDDARRGAAERAFRATGLPYAADTFARVAALLDRYRGAWVSMHEEACRATRVEGRQSDRLLDLRMSCLDERRATLGALTGMWAEGVDAAALENAIAAAAALPPVDECADVRRLSERLPPPADPAARARVDRVRAALDRVRALRDAKRLREARAAAAEARRDADAIGFAPVAAEAALALGSVIRQFGEPEAVASLQVATRLGAAAGDDRLAAAAAVELVGAMGESGQAPAALEVAPLAEALVVRAGDRPEQRGALLVARGGALIAAGKHVEALAVLTRARPLVAGALGPRHPLALEATLKLINAAEANADYARRDALANELYAVELEVLGPDHPQIGSLLGRLGLYACRAGDYATARRRLARSLEIAERSFGPASLPAALALNIVGVLAESEGRLDEARRDYERVLAIRRARLDPEHPLVAHALANLSIVRRLQGHLGAAQSMVETALAIMQRTYGPSHPDVAYELGLLGDVLADRGRAAEARQSYQRALDTWQRMKGSRSMDTLSEMVTFAGFEAHERRCGAARRLVLPALELLEQVAGPNDPELGRALQVAAACDLDSGAVAAAVSRLERALGIEDRPGAAPAEIGAVRFDLARALHAGGGDGVRVSALAQAAAADLERAGPLGAPMLERVRAWQRTRGRGRSPLD